MQHDVHLSEDVDQAGPGARIIAIVVILALFLGIGTYVVYGSALWSPEAQRTSP